MSSARVEKDVKTAENAFQRIEKGIRYIITGFSYISIFLFVVLMLLGTADVIGRYLFDAPIVGTMELSQVIMGGVVLLGWAYTQKNDGHVRVDMFVNRYPPRVQTVIQFMMLLLSLVLFAAITWQSSFLCVQYMGENRVFPTLRVTTVPFYFFVPIGAFFMCLELIMELRSLVPKLRRRG